MTNRHLNLNQAVWQCVETCACVLIVLWSIPVLGQNQATKLDELADLRTSDAMAHLDIFAQRLTDEPDSRGALVTYLPDGWSPGAFQRDVYGYQDYLVNKRGIVSDRLSVVVNGAKRGLFVELWLIPKGASAPSFLTTSVFRFTQLTEFDRLSIGSDCLPQYTLSLEDPSDAIRFFTQGLQQNPTMKGLVVLHPQIANVRETRIVFASTVAKLKNEQSISPDRIMSSVSDPRACGELEFWLVPPDFVVPEGPTAKSYLQSRLIAEAQEKRYTIRMVYFQGNKYIRDSLLRKAIPGLMEGEIFTTAVLHKSLNDLSKLSVIKPIRIGDVDVHLNRSDLTISLTLSVQERTGARR
jgi:hypothetical protein